jgi:Raf kinase inhibitor-like YbhB/YbcL family protein
MLRSPMRILLIASIVLIASQRSSPGAGLSTDATSRTPAREATMRITSSAFGENQPIPEKYTCDGPGTSPPLHIAGVPSSARSLALIVDDPDAPGGTFDHWLLFNIPPTTTDFAEGATAAGHPGRNGFGNTGYGGPCPPDREHRYYFKLYALDHELSLKEGAGRVDLERAMSGHVVAQAQLIGRYDRKRH